MPQVSNARIVRVSMGELAEETLKRLAELYCEIWREPPWNEKFWTVAGVMEDIKEQMAKPCAEAFLMLAVRETSLRECESFYIPTGFVPSGPSEEERTLVLGFTWGYRVTKGDLRRTSGTEALDSLFGDKGSETDVFYVDELGVDSNWRNRGFGRELSEQLLLAAQGHGCARVTLRTHVEQRAARSLYSKLGFKELGVRDAKYSDRSYWVRELISKGDA